MRLQRLPPHITSFFDGGEPPRSLDGATFKKACHQVAHMDGGLVENIELNLVGRSYYDATIRTRTEHLTVLCNSVYPYLAFVPPSSFGPGPTDLTFVKPVHVGSLFSRLTEFQPLDADWLAAELPPDLLADLGRSELEQVGYWKPSRIGDVMFNNWD